MSNKSEPTEKAPTCLGCGCNNYACCYCGHQHLHSIGTEAPSEVLFDADDEDYANRDDGPEVLSKHDIEFMDDVYSGEDPEVTWREWEV